jgi:Holliday junction resolvase-like predicted endonuclease
VRKDTYYPDFQAAASEQGEAFSRDCVMALKYAGLDILNTKYNVSYVGIEIDIVAQNRHGIDMYFECKGSLRKKNTDRPGLERTDTAKKAIANAYLFSLSEEYLHTSPMILLASHVPIGGAGLAMLCSVPRTVIFDIINPREHGDRLRWLANADSIDMEDDISSVSIEKILKQRWMNCK